MAIVLSNGIRQNLLSLQANSEVQSATQLRLATGKRVNSAVDNPINFFTSGSLNDRSNALSTLLDGMSNAVQTINTASKGIDAITKLVQSAQSTVRQALNDAAQNRPSRTGSTVAGVTSGTPPVTTYDSVPGKGAKDIALDKLVEGSAAVPASTSSNGSLGVGAGTTGSTVTLTAGSTTYSFKTTATMTVRELVNNINTSGIATASVDNNGAITVAGSGSDRLTVGIAAPGGTAGDQNTKIGFVAADGDTTASGTGLPVTGGSSTVRANLVQQFNDLRTQIDQLAKDSGFNGINLLGGDLLNVVFNEKTGGARNALPIQGFTVSANNLGIQTAANVAGGSQINFQNDSDLNTASASLTNALTSLRSMASTLGSNLSVVQTRQDFTKGVMTTLRTGADNLVLTDQNEEGANLLALNTRQQLAQQSLSLAAQADQGVLRLFG